MKKVLLALLILFKISPDLNAQTIAAGQMDFTIKGGPGANQVQIFARPGQGFTGKWGQIEFVYGYQTSCPTQAPTMGWTTDPALNSLFGVPYTVVTGAGTSTSPTGYTYNVTSLQLGAGSVNNTIAANTEVLLGTVTFTGGAPSCPIGLMDFADGGSTGTANTFITIGATGDYWSPTYGNSTFYNGVAGGSNTAGSTASTTGSNATSNLNTYAWTNISIKLPVTLVSFEAGAQGCTAALTWTTANEQYFDRFEVEYSADAVSFAKIGSVKSGHNTLGGTYSFRYDQPSGKGAYRLRMVDIDGSSKTSDVRSVQTNCSGSQLISVYPNPATDNVFVNGLSGTEQVSIYTELGQQVINRKATGVKEQFSVGSFAPGIYNVVITDQAGNYLTAVKVIKTN
ncbi:T9SS type A sorting domain-containing protein [Chitinophagaceae bacterium MMS25-I14]